MPCFYSATSRLGFHFWFRFAAEGFLSDLYNNKASNIYLLFLILILTWVWLLILQTCLLGPKQMNVISSIRQANQKDPFCQTLLISSGRWNKDFFQIIEIAWSFCNLKKGNVENTFLILLCSYRVCKILMNKITFWISL